MQAHSRVVPGHWEMCAWTTQGFHGGNLEANTAERAGEGKAGYGSVACTLKAILGH